MAWVQHTLGPKQLPQSCTKCGTVLIDDSGKSDPLDPQPLFANAEGEIAIVIPQGSVFTACNG